MAEKKMIIDGVSCPFTTERNVPPETAAPMPTAAPKQPQTPPQRMPPTSATATP